MKILCDYHHGELYESILKLFEDRLGFEVYRSIGEEWQQEGYWNIGTDPCLIGQYLRYGFATETSEPGIWLENGRGNFGYYKNVIEIYENRPPHKRVTLEKAKNTKWDIIITTMAGHFVPMEEFRKKYCPTAKHIFQIGNMLYRLPEGVLNIMNSTATDCSSIPNVVDYYQEFDPAPLAWKEPINDRKSLYCLLILNQEHKGGDFLQLEKMLDGWVFKEYGSFNRDGNIHKYIPQCEKICEAAMMWHVKRNGDGYGYTLYRSLFAGRPVIINLGTIYRHHRLARLGFFEEGVTSIDYDGKTVEEIRDAVLRMHGDWEKTSRITYDRIRSLVNFDNEEAKIRKFLEDLR